MCIVKCFILKCQANELSIGKDINCKSTTWFDNIDDHYYQESSLKQDNSYYDSYMADTKKNEIRFLYNDYIYFMNVLDEI